MTPKAAVVPRYTPAVYRRRLHQLIIALYVASLVGMLGMIVGAFLNDRSIESNPGRALATVTDVGITRTSVDFQDNKGIYHSPQSGLLYPTGLGEGQQVGAVLPREPRPSEGGGARVDAFTDSRAVLDVRG